MSLQIERQRRKMKKRDSKFTIKVRRDGWTGKIETEDFGSFKQMLAKYKGKYQFWCADYCPKKIAEEGNYHGVRLDSDIIPQRIVETLKQFGKHKAWIDPVFKVDGKPVVLVFNAQFDVGTFGTVTSASVGINTVARLNREKRRKARARAKAKFRTNRRTKRKYRKR